MAVKLKWDKYEAAILLDAYMKIENGDLKRADAIENVSTLLRDRARSRGIEIDNTFRNPNGISYQLGAMQYVVTGGKHGVPHAPMLFQKTFKLYRQNRQEFEEILKAATVQPGIAVDESYLQASTTKRPCNLREIERADTLDEFPNSQDGFRQWMCAVGLSSASVQSYSSAIKNVEGFASNHGYKGYVFYGNDDLRSIAEMVDKLYRDRAFVDYDNGQGKRIRSALRKFQQFLSLRKNVPTAREDTEAANFETKRQHRAKKNNLAVPDLRDKKYDEAVAHVLSMRFQNGYNASSAIDKARLVEYCRELCEVATGDEHVIYEAIQSIGRLTGGRLYAPLSQHEKKIVEGIARDIEQIIGNGATSLSCEMVYGKYEDVARNQLGLFSAMSLGDLVKEYLPQAITYKKTHFLAPGGKPNAFDDVLRYLRDVSAPTEYEKLCDNLWYHKPEEVRSALNGSASIVKVSTNSYLYAYDAPISDEELKRIKSGIDEALLVGTTISDSDLHEIVYKLAPAVLVNTESYASYGIRNVLSVLLGDGYTFAGAGIGSKRRKQSVADIFSEYCQERDVVSLQELKELAKDLNRSGLCWEQIFETMIRVSHDDFVRRDMVNFNVPEIDSVIDSLCDGDYITIKEASLFTLYPSLDIKWSSFLLESYASVLSERFKLVHLNFAEADCCGALVKKNSGISTYEDLVFCALRGSDDWETVDDALKYLVNHGFQKRRNLRGIDELAKRAQFAREEMRG